LHQILNQGAAGDSQIMKALHDAGFKNAAGKVVDPGGYSGQIGEAIKKQCN